MLYSVVNFLNQSILEKFGSSKVDQALIERMSKAIGKPVHHLLRRGKFFSHR